MHVQPHMCRAPVCFGMLAASRIHGSVDAFRHFSMRCPPLRSAYPSLLSTEEDALRKAKVSLQSLLAGGRIVQLEVDIKPEEHPWQQFAGMFADDPDWEALQASMREYREEIDRDSCED
jgi:hypothetical protein